MAVAQNRISIIEARQNEELKEKFFEQNMKLVYKTAFHTSLNAIPLDKEEKLSLGQFGLVKAFNTYNINSGFTFSTYAVRCITNEILMENRKSYHKNRPLSLDKTIFKDDGEDNDLTFMDVSAEGEECFDKEDYNLTKEAYKKFVEIYSEIDPRLVQALDMYIIQDKTTTEIAKAVGLETQSAGSRLATRAIKALQDVAIEMELIENYNRYAKRAVKAKHKIASERDEGIKRRTLYVILNHPELTSKEVAEIVQWSSMKVGKLKAVYTKGKLKITPDDSIKPRLEEYLANKKIIS